MVISRNVTKNRSHSLKLKAYSVTDSCTTIYMETLKLYEKQNPSYLNVKNRLHRKLFRAKHEKRGSVADFKINKANYKDTQITLNEAVLVTFFVVNLNMF